MRPLLISALSENNLQISDDAQEKLLHYLDLMQRWNQVYNLTTITTPREMIYLHLIDSLVIQPYLHGERLLDVGSGAGLPGIPLAIVNPKQQWTLLDKNNKKTRFLTQVVAELGLKNVNVVHSRTEDFHPAYCFDTIVSRAYATLEIFIETSKHLLCDDGCFVAMKGKMPVEELQRIYLLQKADKIEIKGMDAERHVICITKERNTRG